MLNSNTKKLTFCAIMIALATALSFVKFFEMPQGGSVTLASMLTIILISYKCDLKWALTSSIIYGVIQLLQGIAYVPADIGGAILCILLDYVVAFGVLGLAGTFGKLFKNPYVKIIGGTAIAIALRFVCHFLSGILIWASYAEGTGLSPAVYSLTYNGSFLLVEFAITVAITIALSHFILKEVVMKQADKKA